MGMGTSVIGYILAAVLIAWGLLFQMVKLPVEGFWLPVGGASLFALIDTILSIAVGGFATFGDTIVRSGLVFAFVTTACYIRHLAGDPQIRTAVFSALKVWVLAVISALILWQLAPALLDVTNRLLVGLQFIPQGHRSFLFVAPEPGQSATILMLMAYLAHEVKGVGSKWMVVVFIVAALSTLSATAILLFCLLIFAVIFGPSSNNKGVGPLFLLVLILLVSLTVFQGQEVDKIYGRLGDLVSLNFEGSSGTSNRLKQILTSYEQVIMLDFFRVHDGVFGVGFAASLNCAPLSTAYFLFFALSFLRISSLPIFGATLVFIPLASPVTLLFAIASFINRSEDNRLSPTSNTRQKGAFA